MKKKHFDVGTDGFYGAYWKCKSDSDCAMIAMIGDDSEDYLARTSVKWLHKLGVNVMTMSPGKKDYEAMKKLADDAELREKYGDAGRKRVEENFLSTQFCENARRMFSRL